MTRIVLVFIFLLSIVIGLAQANTNFRAFTKEMNPTRKANIALELHKYYNRFNVDSLNVLGIDLKRSNALINDLFVKAVYERILGSFDVKKGFLSEGLRLLQSSRSILLNLGDHELICEAFNETGMCHLLMNDFQQAKEDFNTSIKFGLTSETKTFSYLAMINLAQCYRLNGSLSRAKSYAKSYIQSALRDKKFESVANGYSLLGQIALDEEKTNSAISFFNKQNEFAKKCNAPLISLRAKNNMAIAYFYAGKTEEALNVFNKVLEARKKQGITAYLCDAYLNMGGIYIETRNIEKGIQYLDSSITLSKRHGLITNHIEALEMKSGFDTSMLLVKEIERLKIKQKKIINKERNNRVHNLGVGTIDPSTNKWRWFSYLSLIITLIVLCLFYKKSLSDKG